MNLFLRIFLFTTVLSASAVSMAQQNAPAENNAEDLSDTTTETTPTTEHEAIAVDATPPIVQAQCVPACRSGFMCHQGTCISACNPPCAAGQSCNANAQCSPLQTAAPMPTSQTVVVYSPREQRILDRIQRKEEKKKLRLEYRMHPRFTFHTSFVAAELNTTEMFGGSLGFGLRKWFTPFMSLQGRVSVSMGRTIWYNADYYTDNDLIPTFGVYGDVSPLFGPFGRFYVGPVLGIHSFLYTEHPTFASYYSNEEITLKNKIMGTVGIETGFLLGKHEQFDINVRGKMNLMFEENFIIEIGFGIHLFPGKEN